MRHTGEVDPRLTKRIFFVTPVPADLLPGDFRCRVLPRNRHLQRICRIQLLQTNRLVDHLYLVAPDLHRGLHRVTAYPRVPNA